MLFNSFEFIFLFLPLTLLAYFGFHRLGYPRMAKGSLLVASLIFYGYFSWSYLPLIILSIVVNYGIGLWIERDSQEHAGRKSKARLVACVTGIIFNIGLLGYFKYADFFISNINSLFATDFNLLNILLPLGISFFTFQQVAFVTDCYKGRQKLPSFLDYCIFVTFFPQLIAGPIVLPQEMLPQFADPLTHKPQARNFYNGLFIFSLGLAKKVLIADSIAGFADRGFSMTSEHLTMAEAWLVSLSYTFQLYFDFSGYCDMAIGTARMFNIHLPQNFNAPYRATSIQDFWRRWHITLGRFLTQYVYIPLGGNRVREWRVLLNIGIVFFISGLWHGAGWTFIVWGICHGIGMMIHRKWKRASRKMPSWLGMFFTFFCINILWVLFRADSLHRAWVIIRSMFDNTSLVITPDFSAHLPSILPNSINFLIFCLAVILGLLGPTAYKLMEDYHPSRWKQGVLVICFAAGVLFLTREATFLYFNF